MVKEMTNEEIDQVAGGIPPLVAFVAAVIVRKYAVRAAAMAVTSATAGAVHGYLTD